MSQKQNHDLENPFETIFYVSFSIIEIILLLPKQLEMLHKSLLDQNVWNHLDKWVSYCSFSISQQAMPRSLRFSLSWGIN